MEGLSRLPLFEAGGALHYTRSKIDGDRSSANKAQGTSGSIGSVLRRHFVHRHLGLLGLNGDLWRSGTRLLLLLLVASIVSSLLLLLATLAPRRDALLYHARLDLQR